MTKKSLFFYILLLIIFAIGLRYYFFGSKRDISLHVPRGPFGVGTVIDYFTDNNRKEIHSLNKEARKLVVQLWYPAKIGSSDKLYPFMADIKDHIKKKMSRKINKPVAWYSYLDTVTTHAYLNARIDLKRNKFPLILFSTGLGSNRHLFSSYAQELASHGYIVAIIDRPYASNVVMLEDGTIIEEDRSLRTDIVKNEEICERELKLWLGDLSYVLDQLTLINRKDSKKIFTNHIDLSEIGVMGHSFGGSVALAFCATDKRCKAGVSFDSGPICNEKKFGQIFELNKPFMFLLAGENRAADKLRSAINKYIPQGKKDVYKIFLEYVDHNSFGDAQLIFPSRWYLLSAEARFNLISFVTHFFNHYLKHDHDKVWDQFPSEILAENENMWPYNNSTWDLFEYED